MEAPVVCSEGKDGEGVMHSTPETIPFQSFHVPAALQASGFSASCTKAPKLYLFPWRIPPFQHFSVVVPDEGGKPGPVAMVLLSCPESWVQAKEEKLSGGPGGPSNTQMWLRRAHLGCSFGWKNEQSQEWCLAFCV